MSQTMTDKREGGTAMDYRQAVRAAYDGLSTGDPGPLFGLMDPKIEWTEAAGYPYAGTYVGPDAIAGGVFARLGSEWDGYVVAPDFIVADGDRQSRSARTAARIRRQADRHSISSRSTSRCRRQSPVQAASALRDWRCPGQNLWPGMSRIRLLLRPLR